MGVPVPNCPNCGVPALPQARFCASCGTRLRDDSDTTPVLKAPPGQGGDDDPTDPRLRASQHPTQALAPELVSCASCGAPNVPQRKRCGRCGADINSGEMPRPVAPVAPVANEPRPRQAPRPDVADMTPPTARPAARSGRPSAVNPPVRTSPRYEDIVSEDSMELRTEQPRRRVGWIAVALVGMTLGALLGVALVAGVGPFGADEDPDFFFEPGRYEGAADTLEAARVGASSVRPGDATSSFAPARLVDGDRATAWQSLPDNDAEVFVDIMFEVPVWVTQLDISTGDQSGESAYAESGRPVLVLVTFDGTRPVQIRLDDVPAVQRVALDEPKLTSDLRLRIEDRIGPEDGGVAMSEVTVSGYRADDADARAWRDAYG